MDGANHLSKIEGVIPTADQMQVEKANTSADIAVELNDFDFRFTLLSETVSALDPNMAESMIIRNVHPHTRILISKLSHSISVAGFRLDFLWCSIRSLFGSLQEPVHC